MKNHSIQMLMKNHFLKIPKDTLKRDMNQMKRRNFLRVGLGSAAVLVAPKTFAAEKALDLSSKQVAALFSEFAQTKKMSPELKAWLDDPVIQKIPPYKVFDPDNDFLR